MEGRREVHCRKIDKILVIKQNIEEKEDDSSF